MSVLCAAADWKKIVNPARLKNIASVLRRGVKWFDIRHRLLLISFPALMREVSITKKEWGEEMPP